MLLHGRPELMEECVNAVINCQNLKSFDLLEFSVDPGHPQQEHVVAAARACAKSIQGYGLIRCSVELPVRHVGATAHPLVCLTRAFDQRHDDLYVAIEDDAILKADALRLALWFEHESVVMPDALLLSMSNHRTFGRGTQDKIPELDPSILAESPYIDSPFAWATVRESWPLMKANWGFKRHAPTAWSFSLSMALRMNRKVSVHPVLSRCQNVGRLGGVNETPETFDKTQRGLPYQEGPYLGPYKVRAKLDRKDLMLYDDWMLPELEAMREALHQ